MQVVGSIEIIITFENIAEANLLYTVPTTMNTLCTTINILTTYLSKYLKVFTPEAFIAFRTGYSRSYLVTANN